MSDSRSFERIEFHFNVERQLADRLRGASREERLALYGPVYDELFRRVPDHPQLSQKVSEQSRARATTEQLAFLRPFLREGKCRFLEVGAGDCALSLAIAPFVDSARAVDVSSVISSTAEAPANFSFALSDGISIPVEPGSIDLAYSNQLMEHLHPEDAKEQLSNIRKALKPGGVYVCITPNRISGPHDVSSYFSSVAMGFHLKEYTIRELRDLALEVGFRHVSQGGLIKGRPVRYPISATIVAESLLQRLPYGARRALVSALPLRLIYGNIYLVAS